jgi:hypothetical protein
MQVHPYGIAPVDHIVDQQEDVPNLTARLPPFAADAGIANSERRRVAVEFEQFVMNSDISGARSSKYLSTLRFAEYRLTRKKASPACAATTNTTTEVTVVVSITHSHPLQR